MPAAVGPSGENSAAVSEFKGAATGHGAVVGVVLPEEAERMGLDVETFMSNRMLEILRENEVLYEGGVRSEKRLGGMLGGG